MLDGKFPNRKLNRKADLDKNGKVPSSQMPSAEKIKYDSTLATHESGSVGAALTEHSSQIEALTTDFAPTYNPTLPSYSAYDSTATYTKGQRCIYDGSAYVCNTTISTAEAWTAAHWTVIPIYAVGDFVMHDNALFKCITDINTVEVWTATHWESVDISGFIRDIADPVNLVDEGKLILGKYIYSNGNLIDGSGYDTTDYILIKKGQKITVSPRIRMFIIYDETHTAIQSTYDNTATHAVRTITAAESGFIRFSFYHEDYGRYSAYYGDVSDIELKSSDKYKLNNSTILSERQLEQVGNILYGKKWCVIGDSFSIGGYTAADGFAESVYKYQSGRFKGEQIVYPFIIALRNSMKMVNLAVHGMTMTDVNGTTANSVTHGETPVYTNVPSDADYVTIKIGINDVHASAPLGTIDSTDITTFYGAYNTVLDWITTNRPLTKIGIIVTNGSNSTYTDATIAIAKKWGIPYLDEVNDENVPLLHRADRNGVSSTIKTRKLNAFAVNQATSNTHPNVAAHEYESTFVENWLRSL